MNIHARRTGAWGIGNIPEATVCSPSKKKKKMVVSCKVIRDEFFSWVPPLRSSPKTIKMPSTTPKTCISFTFNTDDFSFFSHSGEREIFPSILYSAYTVYIYIFIIFLPSEE